MKEVLKGNGPEKLRRLLARLRNGIDKRWSQSGIRQRERYVDEAFTLRQKAAYLVAAEKWQAQQSVCDFSVILFRASDTSMSGPYHDFDEDLGWRSYLGDRLWICDAIGGHQGIIEPPNVTELGRKARQFLGSGAAGTLSRDNPRRQPTPY